MVAPFLAKIKKEDLVVLQKLLEAGTVTPVIDRQYELSEAPEALRYLEPDTPKERSSSPSSRATEEIVLDREGHATLG